MATGKELVRMMTCGVWKNMIEGRLDYTWSQIFSSEGRPICHATASKQVFCHARILFKNIDEDKANIIAELLRLVASTSSEQMVCNVHSSYNFTEIIIS